MNRLEELRVAVNDSLLATPAEFGELQRRAASRIRRRRILAAGSAAAAIAIVAAIAGVSYRGQARRATIETSPAGGSRVLALVEPGQVAPMFLSDGTPVWEVRSDVGTVTVLAAAGISTAGPAFPFSGVGVLTSWVPSAQRFVGPAIFDSQGRFLGVPRPGPTSLGGAAGSGVDMGRYDVTVTGSHAIVGAYHAGQKRPAAADVGWSSDSSLPANAVNFDQLLSKQPLLSVAEALALPAGSVTLVDAAVVAVGSGPARVCSGGRRLDRQPFPPCPDSAPALPGVGGQPGGSVYGFGGPLLLRTGPGGFSSVIATGSGYAQYSSAAGVPAPAP